jgi:hypothetical protein
MIWPMTRSALVVVVVVVAGSWLMGCVGMGQSSVQVRGVPGISVLLLLRGVGFDSLWGLRGWGIGEGEAEEGGFEEIAAGAFEGIAVGDLVAMEETGVVAAEPGFAEVFGSIFFDFMGESVSFETAGAELAPGGGGEVLEDEVLGGGLGLELVVEIVVELAEAVGGLTGEQGGFGAEAVDAGVERTFGAGLRGERAETLGAVPTGGGDLPRGGRVVTHVECLLLRRVADGGGISSSDFGMWLIWFVI